MLLFGELCFENQELLLKKPCNGQEECHFSGTI